jgi:UDP-sugar transporter A1/2/3
LAFVIVKKTLNRHFHYTLEPAIFQVFNQAKLFTTAVFAYFILRKVLSGVQWISLVVLAIGIVTVQITSKGQAISFQDPADVTLGFILMMIVSFFSGFASVYTELYLKKGNDFWATNAQMAAFSLAPATAMIIFESLHLKSFDIFEYFGGWALSTVLMNALGGIIVSMVIKYADSVLKAFAIAAAILLTIVVNVVFLGAHFRLASLIGIMTVLCSVFLYSAPSLTTRERRQQVHTLEDNTRLEHLKEVDNLEDEETKV